jgi:hypothetical protein
MTVRTRFESAEVRFLGHDGATGTATPKFGRYIILVSPGFESDTPMRWEQWVLTRRIDEG